MSRRTVQFFVLLLATASIAWSVRQNGVPVDRLANIAWYYAALIAGSHMLCNVLLAESLRTNVGRKQLSFATAFHATCLRAYANLLFPFAGTGYAAYRLKRDAGIPITRLGIASFEWTAHQYLAAASLGLAATALLGRTGEESALVLIVFGAALFASIAWMFISRLLPLRWSGRFEAQVLEWRQEQLGVFTVFQSITLQILLTLVRAARFAFALLALSMWPGLPETLLMSISGDLVSLVNLTPNGIGLREALVTLTADLLEAGAGAVLLAALVERTIVSLMNIVLGALFLRRPMTRVEDQT